MDLQSFMDKVEMNDTQVGAAVGKNQSIIYRVRLRKVVPDAVTLLLLTKWSEKIRKKRHWSKRFALSWDYILRDAA